MPAEQMSEDEVLQVKVKAEDLESGIARLELTWDGETVQQGNEIALTGLAGKHMFTARAVNGVGLVTEAAVEVTVTAGDQAAGVPGIPVLSDNHGHGNGLRDGNYTITMNMWWGNNAKEYKLYENGELLNTQKLSASTPAAQKASTSIEGRANGTYVYTCELTNAKGTTACQPLTVIVRDAAPSKPELSHDNWDGDGNYTITMNMWWGTNATSYRLYENGTEVDSQPLTVSSPNAQTARFEIKDRAIGEYEYVVEWINASGKTTSEPIRVSVTR
jgi:hypothetical protein